MPGMENDSRFGVLSANASGLDGERIELGRFGLAEVQKHGIIPPPPTPTQPRTPKIFRNWLKLHARVRAAVQLLRGLWVYRGFRRGVSVQEVRLKGFRL